MEQNSSSQKAESRVKRRRGGTRRKTGCSTCKARHTRCDEKKPRCGNCERLDLECLAGQFISQSTWCSSEFPKPTPVGIPTPPRTNPAPIHAPLVNSTIAETLTPSDGSADLNSTTSPRPSAELQTLPVSTWEIFQYGTQGLATTPISTDATLNIAPWIASPVPFKTSQPALPLLPQAAHLFQIFREQVSTWMDIFDYGCSYQREITRRAMFSELLQKCVCAFTAKHLSLLASGDVWAPMATEYYTQALALVIEELKNPKPPGCALSAVIMLSSYEVLAAQGQEHRRHYEGALMLIRLLNVNAQSDGLHRANFWIWVRHDLIVAIVNKTPLKMPSKKWNVAWNEDENREDILGQQILWHVGRAVDYIYGEGSAAEYHSILQDVERWFNGVDEAFRGVKYGSPLEDGLSKVYFASPAAAAAMIWYHVFYILMYGQSKLAHRAHQRIVEEHALEIISISLDNLTNAARCFSVIPLYLAGRYVPGIVNKLKAIELLGRIQTDLGYFTLSQRKALQNLLESG